MRTILVFCFLSLQSSLYLYAQTDEYIWPTNASPYLSSTFAETRSAHFHSGLDIKTWGREGYKVFASKSGYLSRMAISAQGYGRVLYLTHDDGSVTVYAHLQRFIPELQSYIDSLRLIDHSFEIDLTLEENRWKFEQGEVIGYTGSTGVGPPHLHFEIRKGNEVAINALQTNLRIKDTIPPRITSMLVIPLSDSSTINGSKFPRIFYPEQREDDSLDFGTFEAYGPVGVAISEYDAAEDVTNKYASYQYILSQKSDTLFKSIHQFFHFDDAPTMPLDRITAYGASRRSYQTLYDDSDVEVPFYDRNFGNGFITPESVQRAYKIAVSDIYGNTTTASFQLQEGTTKPSLIISEAPEIGEWYWQNDWVVQHSSSTFNLKGNNFGVNWNRELNQRLLYFDGNHLLFNRVYPDSAFTFWTVDRNAKIHFPAQSTFDELSVAAFTTTFQGFPALQIQPNTAPLRRNVTIEWFVNKIDTLGANPQLFHYDRCRDRFSHVPSTLIGNTLHAQTSNLGEFVVFSDSTPPEISGIQLVQKNWGAWQVEIIVADQYSGIDFNNSEIRVNGIRGITEYDFEEDILIFLHPDFAPEESNRIEVIVSDNAGNSMYQTFRR